MKQYPSQEKLKRLFAYNEDTGDVTRLIQCGKMKPGSLVGSKTHFGYTQTKVDNNNYFLHRIIWKLVYGKDPDGVIDHIDGNKRNNAISNLRDVSIATNNEHQRNINRKSKSGVFGAVQRGDKYAAMIVLDGVQKYLGTFKTADEAHQVYLNAKRMFHRGCTL